MPPDSQPTKPQGNAEEAGELGQLAPQTEEQDGHEQCRVEAWRLYCEGIYTYRAIARGVNDKTNHDHDHHWVKRNLERYSQVIAEIVDNGAIDARAEYLEGLRRDLVAQAAHEHNPETDPAKITARKAITEIRQKIAAARGVVTERKATTLQGGDADAPALRITFESTNGKYCGDGVTESASEGLPEAAGDPGQRS